MMHTEGTISGPSFDAAIHRPVAVPFSFAGNQRLMTFVQPMPSGPSDKPSPTRYVISKITDDVVPINPVNTSFAGNEDTYANNNIPNIPGSLSGCASPGFFYTANTPADITASLKKMFDHALVHAHLTH